MSRPVDVAVVGAGVFGAWIAFHLRRAGKSVVLLDAYGAANSRASSPSDVGDSGSGYEDTGSPISAAGCGSRPGSPVNPGAATPGVAASWWKPLQTSRGATLPSMD